MAGFITPGVIIPYYFHLCAYWHDIFHSPSVKIITGVHSCLTEEAAAIKGILLSIMLSR